MHPTGMLKESDIPQNWSRSRLRRWSSLPWFHDPRAGRIYPTHWSPDRMIQAHGRGHSRRQWRETERESQYSLWCVDIKSLLVLSNMLYETHRWDQHPTRIRFSIATQTESTRMSAHCLHCNTLGIATGCEPGKRNDEQDLL